MNFLKSIKNVAQTRKFWVGVLGAVGVAVLQYLTTIPEFTPVVSLLTAWGVWYAPNTK